MNAGRARRALPCRRRGAGARPLQRGRRKHGDRVSAAGAGALHPAAAEGRSAARWPTASAPSTARCSSASAATPRKPTTSAKTGCCARNDIDMAVCRKARHAEPARQNLPGRFVSKTKNRRQNQRSAVCFGAPAGTRILDPLIKSQMLYQLSYGHLSCCQAGSLSSIPCRIVFVKQKNLPQRASGPVQIMRPPKLRYIRVSICCSRARSSSEKPCSSWSLTRLEAALSRSENTATRYLRVGNFVGAAVVLLGRRQSRPARSMLSSTRQMAEGSTSQ